MILFQDKFTKSQERWLVSFTFLVLAAHFSTALMSSVLGQTQAYIAVNIGIPLEGMSFQWTVGGAGWNVGSFMASLIFKRFITSSKWKMFYFATVLIVIGITKIALPFSTSLGVYFFILFLSSFVAGCYAPISIAHMVYTMGPYISRPYTMMIHLFVGIGFFVGSVLVRPFLPADSEEVKRDHQAVCYASNSTNTTVDEQPKSITDVVDTVAGLPSVFWPYIIIGILTCVVGFLFCFLAISDYEMPVHQGFGTANEEDDSVRKSSFTKIKYWIPLICLVFVFYMMSCGIERIFQSNVYTLGLCGPLQLNPQQANVSDASYNGAFMVGRILGVLLAAFIVPRNMIIISLASCIAASIVLTAVASSSMIGLYAGSALVGFSVSWQYGCVFNWVAQKVDVTGVVASLFAISCSVGGMTSVPVISYLSKKSSPTIMVWVVLGICIVQILVYAMMWLTARPLKNPKENGLNLTAYKSTDG